MSLTSHRRLDRLCIATGALVGLLGVLKLIGCVSNLPMLEEADPVLGIRFRVLWLVVGLVEIGAASVLLSKRPLRVKVPMVAWLATNFLIYRLGLQFAKSESDCGCAGILPNLTQLSAHEVALITYTILGLMCLVGFGGIAWLWTRGNALQNKESII